MLKTLIISGEFLPPLKGSFSIISLTECWCDKIANNNSIKPRKLLFSKEKRTKKEVAIKPRKLPFSKEKRTKKEVESACIFTRA